ncbi:hypothetical protein Cagg_0187 [Chloroflexus aggregans DSM 9485]|uniref:Uncharacterized protein n=1 Tax=Chloroflexus aggregans (strain MD-66 / DSM 9485) TaxID=326427 RepID=B8GCT8_CHLAD|nr:hypothetical protein Cagg_0187 [Chloroflexus aggregans DSM 9485]
MARCARQDSTVLVRTRGGWLAALARTRKGCLAALDMTVQCSLEHGEGGSLRLPGQYSARRSTVQQPPLSFRA